MTTDAAPLFGSVALAERIERVETQLITAATEAARVRVGAGAFVIPITCGAACYAEDGSPLNKIVGLGFGGVPSGDSLDEIEQAFVARACAAQVELSNLADPDIEGVPSHEDFPREVVEKAIGDMEQASATPYLAFRGGVVAGGASMRISEGVAQLTGAATAPAHRRHGVQTALLSARLADAVRAGCEIAVVTTQPGSKSQQNVQRRGFHLLYTRAVLVKSRSVPLVP
jgi:GNAT superfamily N-acetyltransferase